MPKMGQREGNNAVAAKEPVVCEREAPITNHPGLPCLDTGWIFSMPQIPDLISNIITASYGKVGKC